MTFQVKTLVTQFLDAAESWEASAALGLQLLTSVSAVLHSCDAAGGNVPDTAPSFSKILETLEQVQTFRLHEYASQKSWRGRPSSASLKQLMDSLAGLQNTSKLLRESSKALLEMSLEAEEVVRDMLSSRDDWTCCLGRDSQDPRGAEQMEGGDGGDVRWLWAANAALCMKGLAEGVQQCTDVLERIAEEVGPDTSVDRLATLTLIWELQPHVCPTLRTILEAFCD